MSKRPNILFLMSDQHRADVTGYEGNEVIRTPVLDELARTGVVFRNAYTPAPICIPGRQCMMAGQLPKTCGCEGWVDLQPNYLTFARQFARHMYNTVCSGKLHHIGTDQMQGWTKRIAPDAEISDKYIEGRDGDLFARYTSELGTGKWSNQKEIERAGVGGGPYRRFDDFAEESAIDFIHNYFCDEYYDRPQSHRPLLLKVSFLQPHYPFLTDEERFSYYLNRVPLFLDEPCDHPVLSLSQQWKSVEVTQRDIRRTTAAYYGMVETVDARFGNLLDTLEHVGVNLDEWIIVYTSDHGEMLGEHGIWEKTRLYDGCARVPLIVRWPREFEPRVVKENVNLCDLFATLCDLAGLPIPDGLDSRSLVPLMRGDASGWSNETVSQIDFGRHLMIKQDSLKYQYYGEDVPEVLFDLAKDPGETTNLADDPTYSGAMNAFRKRRAELGFGPSADPDYVNAGY